MVKKRKNSFECNGNEEEEFRLNMKSHPNLLRKKRANTYFPGNSFSLNQSKDSKKAFDDESKKELLTRKRSYSIKLLKQG